MNNNTSSELLAGHFTISYKYVPLPNSSGVIEQGGPLPVAEEKSLTQVLFDEEQEGIRLE